MLLPKPGELPDHVLIEAFIDSLSLYDAAIVQQGIEESGKERKALTEELGKGLISILSVFDCRELPHPQNLIKLVSDIATYQFIRKPATTIADIHSGVPPQHMTFWAKMKGGTLYEIYKAMQATTAKVLSMIDGVEPKNANEERILSYLRQYIGNLRRRIIYFLTICDWVASVYSQPN